jgi:hypothetical protein
VSNRRRASQEEIDVDHNEDRYPTLARVLALIHEALSAEGVYVERVEVTCLANGDATYRVWQPRAEEPDEGFFAAADSQ